MDVPIFREIICIFALSIAVLLVCHRLKLPSVVGFLITGVICGPHGLQFVTDVEDVENLSTVGVVLLLFTVGMEFSFKNIVRYKYDFVFGGALQILFTIAPAVLFGVVALGKSVSEAIFLGFVLSLSSTAIVIAALEDKRQSDTRQGRLILSILIFQDIIAIPMMLLTPLLAGSGDAFDMSHVYTFIKGMFLLGLVAFIAFRGIPKLLYYVTRTRQRELFLVSIFTICFTVAWVTSSLGLSLSLGAFFAGLVISESEYSEEAVGNVLPFQEIFTSFFFVSMGMLLDLSFVASHLFTVVLVTICCIAIKAVMAGSVALLRGLNMSAAIMTALSLAQIGEFSLILAHVGMDEQLISEYNYQLILAAALLSMTAMPFVMSLSEKISMYVGKLPLPDRFKMGAIKGEESGKEQLSDHIIICGFGLRGKHLARAAKETGIAYHVLDTDPDLVKAEKLLGESISFGDPSHASVLLKAGIRSARTVAVLVHDSAAAKRIVKTARDLNPNVYIITRTIRFVQVAKMLQLGANDAIPDEFGASLEVLTRALLKSDVSQDLIRQCAHTIRAEGYEELHLQSFDMHPLPQVQAIFKPVAIKAEA